MSTYWVSYKGTRFPIRRGETILGRSPYCSIVISDDLVSREHCALRLGPEGLTIADLNSTNGVTVNGALVHGVQVLKAGDALGVGTATLEVIVVDAAMRSTANATRNKAEPPPRDDDQVTLKPVTAVDLIEALLESAPEAEQARSMPLVRRAVDDVIGSATHLTPETKQRLTTIAAAVVERAPGEYDDWRRGILAAMERLE
ncbi:MAG: FHA domain-containing protein [Polyangiaceae bacterium]|nr:FHA domain-containing protein [Polyangiaceae bacterium]MCW5792090.1 FHA domain-containing protein [Polyangiaceae bacterium]